MTALKVIRSKFFSKSGLAPLVFLAALLLFSPDTTLAQQAQPTGSAPAKPNILVILSDDVGYGDLSCYGATAIRTPNIDRLAAAGLRFTSGYCSASTCTPTRYSLITGKYAFRTKGTGIAPPNATALIRPGTETIASLLKKAGYRTAVVGKWHLGLGGPDKPDWNGELNPGPLELGFDYCFILPTTPDRVPQIFVEDHRVAGLDPKDPIWVGDHKPFPDFPTGITERDKLRMDWSFGHNDSVVNGIGRIGFFTGGNAARWRDEELAGAWVQHAVAWLEKERTKPFFLYYAPHDIHVPRMPHQQFWGKSPLGWRGDSILELDWGVGQILQNLERMGLANNTLIIFSSDNGPVLDDGYKDQAVEKLGGHKPAGPFSGGKYTIQEGGTRMPFITWWPGRIKPGMSDNIVCTIDLCASLAALAGVPLAPDACPDSLNVLDALLGVPGAKGRDELVEQDNGNAGNYGFRAGEWKLQRHGHTQGGRREQLFNLTKDPAEKDDVAAQNPEVLQRLSARLDAILAASRTRP
jgi:arylsulfatase A